jgi:anti-sigma factor ChrR (cupin superfamily)
MTRGCPGEEFLARWIEGSLGDADHETVRAHLAACDPCRRSVELARLTFEGQARPLSPIEHARAMAVVCPGTVCADIDLWSRWVEGTLGEAERRKVDGHLVDCDDCRRTVELSHISFEASAKPLSPAQHERALDTVLQGRMCEETEFWARWAEEALDEAERDRAARHLAGCDACRRAVMLARLAGEGAAPTMSDTARRRVEKAVIVSPVRRGILRVWHVAAAAAVIVGVSMYFAFRSPETPAVTGTGPSEESPAANVTTPPTPRPVAPAAPGPQPPGTDAPQAPDPVPPAPSPAPPKTEVVRKPAPPTPDIVPDPPRDPVVPGRPDPRTPDPKLLAGVPVSDPVGISVRRGGGSEAVALTSTDILGQGDVLIAEKAASFSVDGAALVAMEPATQLSVASLSGQGYLLLMFRGRAFVDTAGGQQAWDVRYGDSSFWVNRVRGRMSVDTTVGVLSLGIVSGEARFQHGVAEESVKEGGRVTLTKEGKLHRDAVDAERLQARWSEIRPAQFTALRLDFGGSGAFVVKSGRVETKEPGSLVADGTGGPTKDRIWAGVQLARRGIVFEEGMILRIRYRASTNAMVLHCEGYERLLGRHGAGEWVEQSLPFHDLKRGDQPMEYGTPIQSIFVGCLKGETLEVDRIEIIRQTP